MLIEGKLRKEVTPKRVFSVLKLINMYNRKMKKETVYALIQPSALSDRQDEIRKVVSFLINEKIITENIDGKLEINIDKENLKSIKVFKEYCSENIFKGMKEKSLFFEITSEILSKDLDFYEFSGFDEIGNRLENKVVDEEFMLAWRFWAEFLGYGKILNNQFLINPYIRILDRVINNSDYAKDKYPVSRLISIIKTECPEFEKTIGNNTIGLSLTLALRTLESIGKIKLNSIKDSTDVWKLYYSAIDKSEITDVEIVRGN
ncbi:hypothetical protein [Clostridium baratii]|uniref:hypothetical protein n=1 Tax=Clostridium baratii TaxID=1561 RepID=UPI0030CCD145